jgi:carboxypeptidase family protein
MTRCLTLALLGVLTGVPLCAQTVGAIVSGIVSDESGARLPGVTITITNVSNGRTQTVVSGGHGEYRAVALQPAPYRIAADLAGFGRSEQDVTLTVGSDSTLDFRLPVAGVRESLTVAAPSLSFEVAQSQPSSVVTEDQIRALPELGRSFLVLAQLLPGSGPLNASVTRFATTKFGGVADQRSGFTTLIDGGDVDDAQWGSPTINLTQESVKEFKVFRYQFDAQYGNALNAVVSVVTKSGGNHVDGSAFYFGRDDALNARNAFAQGKPPFDEQRLGGTLGGPLARNRTHLFGTYESDAVDTVRIIALPATSRFAARENGVFPATSDDRMAVLKLDHRFSPAHSAFVRYAYANQSINRLLVLPSSDTNQVDTFSRAHSIVAEEDWILSPRTVNALRVHWFSHTSGGVPHRADRGVAEIRQNVNLGLVNGGEWLEFPRTEVSLANTIYKSTSRHDVKFGGEFGFGANELHGHFFEDGLFTFTTDDPFDPGASSTWPISFVQQSPNVQTYRSRQIALFVQDDWRAVDRVRLNLGLRYDIDPTLRLNDFYKTALNNPALAGLSAFVSGDRGTDTNNLQPRVGATIDLLGDGTRVLRGGWGLYVARNRPWFQVRSMNQLHGSAIRIGDGDARLKLYPDVPAVVAGGGPRQLGTVIPDDFVQSYALNTSVGAGFQVGRATSLDVDYIHSYGAHQYGTTDRNLPSAGRISTNPRPLPQFGQVAMLENYTKSWYDALESQFRTRLGGSGNLQVSYTLSRAYLDGVDFFLNQRGTQRTPQERGFSPSDQRHNLTTAVSLPLPGQFQLSAILKLISGSPMPVQTGTDFDGDGSLTGDRPPGLPITVGRGDTQEAVNLINAFRASLPNPLAAINPTLVELDPYRTLDLRVMKSFSITGGRRIELLMEAFNVTNYVNYVPAVVTRNMNSALFLYRNGARDARQLQWGLRFVF